MQITEEMIDPYLIDIATKAATASLAEHSGDAEKAATAVLVALDNDTEDMGERVLKETMLMSMGPDGKAFQLRTRSPHWLVVRMASALAESIGPDAENYTETAFSPAGQPGERFALIVQRADKMTPHEFRRKAEAERDEALAEVERLQAILFG